MAGARTGAVLRHACEGTIPTGARVLVEGRLNADPGPSVSGGPARLRVTLRDVTIRSGEQSCATGTLLAFPAAGSATEMRAGRTVRLAGGWLRMQAETGRWPTPTGRSGLLVDARVVSTGEPAGTVGRGSDVPGPTWAERLRVRASRRLAERLPGDVRPTARALLLAERDELPGQVRRRFADAGLAHLLAISGMHVGILAALLLALVSSIVTGRARHPLTAGLVGGYVVVIGAPAPATRAGLVFAGWAWGRARGRPVRTTDLVGTAALAALLADPSSLLEPGFQLSFAGFGGVLLAGGIVSGRPSGGRGGRAGRFVGGKTARHLLLVAATGAGAFFATAPIAATHFGRIAPVSMLSHFAGTPLVGLAVVGLAVSLLPGPFPEVGADAATWAVRALHVAAGFFAGLPGGHGDASPPGPVVWLAWASAGFGLARLASTGRAIRTLVPLGFAGFLLLAGPAAERLRPRGPVLLCTLAVGQGDAAFLRTSGRRWIVFDGGPPGTGGAGRETLTGGLRRRGARSVALAVLSHPDLDHVGGLESLLAEIGVGALLDSGDPLPRPVYARLLAAADARGVSWVEGRAGTRLELDGVDLVVLGPAAGAGPGPARANATSLIVRVTIGGFRYLNPGDATREEEAELLRAWPAESLRADILKVGHHGSRTSTSAAWLDAVRPSLAVISAGPANRYGHPHPEVLRRLDAGGVPEVWRTDHDGTLCIEVRSDGGWRKRGEAGWREPGVARRSGGTKIEWR